jgi:hypothetical protein
MTNEIIFWIIFTGAFLFYLVIGEKIVNKLFGYPDDQEE